MVRPRPAVPARRMTTIMMRPLRPRRCTSERRPSLPLSDARGVPDAYRPTRPFPRRSRRPHSLLAVLGMRTVRRSAHSRANSAPGMRCMFNWMFFATISSAGVAFAAVQRIVDGALVASDRALRRRLRRVPAGRVRAPAADPLPGSRSTSSRGPAARRSTARRRRRYLDPMFFALRGIVIFGSMIAAQLWFVYRSVRLDVAVLPKYGREVGEGLRQRMRNGFGDERRELHTQHSTAGQAGVAVAMVFVLRLVLCWRGTTPCRSRCTSSRRCTPGSCSWAAGSGMIMSLSLLIACGGASICRCDDLVTDRPLLGHRQAVLRVHRVLRLHQLQPVPGDLVRQHAGRDALLPPAPHAARGSR